MSSEEEKIEMTKVLKQKINKCTKTKQNQQHFSSLKINEEKIPVFALFKLQIVHQKIFKDTF